MKKVFLNWRNYRDFDVDTINNKVAEAAGVYLIWVRINDGSWRIYYVGQTDNLKKRLLQHLSDNEQNHLLKEMVMRCVCGISFAVVNSHEERTGIERFFYEHYSPKCNLSMPPKTRKCYVNIPE